MHRNLSASPALGESGARMPVLVATSEFPGKGGARHDKFVSLLPRFGCDPIVICPQETASPDSERLIKELFPPSLEVYRARSLGWSYFAERFLDRGPDARHYRLLSLLSFPERFLYVPDYMVRWVPDGIRLAKRLIAKKSIPVVLTTSPAESTRLIGLALKRSLGVRWVADFRDLWTARTLLFRPATAFHDRAIRRLERRILETADHIIANTDENLAYYVNTFGIDPQRISVIPNGFDRNDILGTVSTNNDLGDVFQIGYMGNLSKHDLPWRSFLDALKMLVDDVGPDKIRFVHCGFASEEVAERIRTLKLDEVVVQPGLLPHVEAMEKIASTHLRLVLLADNGYSKAMVPAKLYHYLIMNGPVLAVAPECGAVARLLTETRMGMVVSPDCSPSRLACLMRGYYDAWKRGELKINPDSEQIDKYDRHRHVGQLARIFRSINGFNLALLAQLGFQ